MREEFNLLLSNRGNRYALALSMGFFTIGVVFFLVKVWQLPPLIPIFYNRPWGIPQLGTPFSLVFLLLLALAFILINMTLAVKLHKNIILLSRILLWISVLISLLTTTAVVHIILLIT